MLPQENKTCECILYMITANAAGNQLSSEWSLVPHMTQYSLFQRRRSTVENHYMPGLLAPVLLTERLQ